MNHSQGNHVGANTINYINKKPEANVQQDNEAATSNPRGFAVGLLSNEFHLPRIMKIAKKFLLQGAPQPAESIITARRKRYGSHVKNYYSVEGNNEFRSRILADFEDAESDNREVSEIKARLGGSFEDTLRSEVKWSEALEQIPEYWMQSLAFIEDPELLRVILKIQTDLQRVLREEKNLDIDKADTEDIKEALRTIERKMP